MTMITAKTTRHYTHTIPVGSINCCKLESAHSTSVLNHGAYHFDSLTAGHSAAGVDMYSIVIGQKQHEDTKHMHTVVVALVLQVRIHGQTTWPYPHGNI